MIYTAEEEFYGRAAADRYYTNPTNWSTLHEAHRASWIEAAKAARAAVYVDPVQEVANRLYAATSTGAYARPPAGNATGDWLLVAEAAIAMGAKP
jgi:hypothetical protein